MTRELTRSELQRCADYVDRETGAAPFESSPGIARLAIDAGAVANAPWAIAVRAEAARILAGDVDARDAEIARLRERLAMAIERMAYAQRQLDAAGGYVSESENIKTAKAAIKGALDAARGTR